MKLGQNIYEVERDHRSWEGGKYSETRFQVVRWQLVIEDGETLFVTRQGTQERLFRFFTISEIHEDEMDAVKKMGQEAARLSESGHKVIIN